MQQLDYVDLYLMEIFLKTDSQNIIQKINQRFGNTKQTPGKIRTIGSTENEIEESKYKWEVKKIQQLLDHAEEIGKGGLAGDVSLARISIEKINLIGIQNDVLPYFLLIMTVKVDKNKLKLERLFDDTESILRPLRLVMEELNGITRQLFSAQPICPYFFDAGVLTSQEEINEINQISNEILDLEEIRQSVSVEQILDKGSKIRNRVPFSNLKIKSNLLSIVARYSNVVAFIGHLDQVELNGLMTPFLIKFSEEERKTPFEMDTFLSIRPHSYDSMTSPWSAAGTMIFLVSMYSYILYLEKSISKIEPEFLNLRKKIYRLIKSKEETELENYVLELDINMIKIADFTSEVGRLMRVGSSQLSDFLKGRKSYSIEIAIPPPTKTEYYYFWSSLQETFGTTAYVQAITKKITDILKKLETNLKEHNHENEILHGSINNIVSLRDQKENRITQKTIKFTGRIAALSSASTVAATIMILILTTSLVDLTDELVVKSDEMDEVLNKIFKAQNFTPNLWADGNDINLRNENGKTSWGYTNTITVHADSNNFLKFTVKDVIEVYHGGECYFEVLPVAEIYQPQSITLSDSERTGTIKQVVQIEYKPRENLAIDTKELPEYGYNKGFVSLIYEIEVENIQTGEIYPLKSDNSYLWVSVPPEKMNEAERCS